MKEYRTVGYLSKERVHDILRAAAEPEKYTRDQLGVLLFKASIEIHILGEEIEELKASRLSILNREMERLASERAFQEGSG